MMLRRTLLGCLLVAMGAMSSACWFSSPSASALVGRATDRALDSDSVSFELEVAFEGDINAEALEYSGLRAHGAIDRKAERSVFVFGSADLEIEVRTIDDFTYTRMSDGDGWTKMDAGEFLELGDLFGPLFDPYAILQDLGLDPADVQDEGDDVVRGKPAQRYSVDVPAREYDDAVEDFLPVNGDTTIRFWIGEDGLPARIIIESRGDGDDFGVDANGEVVARLMVDLFDYGKPVEIEVPPADEIVDLPSFSDIAGGAYEDPFEGAECYGDRLDECLAPNPEVDAMAQDPAVCQHFDVRVCLVPMGYVHTDVIRAVVDFHKQTKNIDVVILPSIPLTEAEIDRENTAATTVVLDERMKSKYITTGTASTFVGISAIDQQQEGGGWWFGHRFGRSGFSNQHGMFSYFRMLNVEPYNGNPITDELVHLRVSKYVARYTALLLLDYPAEEDIDYLNYYEMYGFSDLDAMEPNWPTDPPPCLSNERVVCIVPDNEYEEQAFEDDVIAAAARIARETGIRVEVRADEIAGGYVQSKPDWGTEFAGDLSSVLRDWAYHYPEFPIVGVTDDNLAQDASVAAGIDRWYGDIQMSIVSGYGAGTPGTAQHQERIYRLLLRGVLVAQFGMELSDDPNSLMFRGITTPADLDGKAIPPIPKVD